MNNCASSCSNCNLSAVHYTYPILDSEIFRMEIMIPHAKMISSQQSKGSYMDSGGSITVDVLSVGENMNYREKKQLEL